MRTVIRQRNAFGLRQLNACLRVIRIDVPGVPVPGLVGRIDTELVCGCCE